MPTPLGMYESPYESQQIDQQLALKRASNLFDSTSSALQAQFAQQQKHDLMTYGMDAFDNSAQQINNMQPAVSQQVTDMFNQQNAAQQHDALQAYGGMQFASGVQSVDDQMAQQQAQAGTSLNVPFGLASPLPQVQNQQQAIGQPESDQSDQENADTTLGPQLPFMPEANNYDSATASTDGSDYISQARDAATQAGINPDLFVRQIQAESNFNPQAVSSAGARGIAQFMPSTAQGLGINPDDPLQALNAAAKLMASYGATDDPSTWTPALAKYNAGPNGNPNNPETVGYVSKVLGNGDTVHGDSGVATAAAAAIQAGARPSDVAYAERNLDADAFKGLCEAFVETAETGHAGIASSASARWDQMADSRVEDPALKGIKVGDEVHFYDPNNPNGHVGIYDGNGTFISATDNGVKKYNIKQWQKMTGQSALGYIPIEGSTADTASQQNGFRLPGVLGQAQDTVGQGLSAIGSGFSGLGENVFSSLKTPALDAIHTVLKGTPFDQTAVEQANQQRQTAQFGFDPNATWGMSAAGYSEDPVADMVASGMNPVNPLDWSRYLGTRLLDATTQGITGSQSKTFAESGAGKFPILGGLVEGTLGDPLQLAAMLGTGGIEGGAGLAARAAAFGIPALSAASEEEGATPESTAAAGALGAAGSLVPDALHMARGKPTNADIVVNGLRDELSQLLGDSDPGELIKTLAAQNNKRPEQVAQDIAHNLVVTVIGGGSEDNTGKFANKQIEDMISKALYDRYYHGTATTFDTPVASPDGLQGPGYYMTSDPRIAGGIVDPSGRLMRLGYAQMRTADQITDPATRLNFLKAVDDLAQQKFDNAAKSDNIFSQRFVTSGRDRYNSQFNQMIDDLIDQQDNTGATISDKRAWRTSVSKLLQKARISPIEAGNIIAKLEDTTGEAQIRPLDVPKDLNLFDFDKPIGNDLANTINDHIDKGWLDEDRLDNDITPETTGQELYTNLARAYGNKADATDFLAANGYHGIKVEGGNVTPMLDETGQPIKHNNVIIFENAMDRIRNSLTGLPEEPTAKSKALSEVIRQDATMHANVKDILTDPDLSDAERTSAVRKAIGC